LGDGALLPSSDHYPPSSLPFSVFTNVHHILVGGLEHFLFFHILGTIISTDELIFFRGVETTKQYFFRIFHIKHCPSIARKNELVSKVMMPGGSIYTFQVATKMATSPKS